MALVRDAEKQIAECHCEMQLQLKLLSSLLKKRLPFSVCTKVCSNFGFCPSSIVLLLFLYLWYLSVFKKNKTKKT